MAVSRNQEIIAGLPLNSPLALDPKNFTSIHRTPWAGRALAAGIKRYHANSASQKIGESWEVSCDPDAPSSLRQEPEVTLAQVIAQRTSECLSSNLVNAGRNTCDILIKLLNAEAPLSLQIHPTDSNASLKANECGKPESWLVLDHEDGAGIYLGFRQALPVKEIKERLASGTFSADLLQFVTVRKGDYFEIEPHVPHAIGPGVVLLEPQRIVAGKSGKTWRLWDWNRKYNSNGEEDNVNGKSRELHIEEAVPLLDPIKQSGPSYVDSLRKSASTLSHISGVTIKIFPENPWYQTISIEMNPMTKVLVNADICYGCLSLFAGQISSLGNNGNRSIMKQGESYFLPAVSLPLELVTERESAHFTIIIPAGLGVPQRNIDEFMKIFA